MTPYQHQLAERNSFTSRRAHCGVPRENAAIWVENLGKKYLLNRAPQTFRETLNRMLIRPFRGLGNLKRYSKPAYEEFWAVRNITFAVKRGEVLGIIGRNGSGKSTLLKIISRITRPTEGYVKLFGSVGSLLEVGTGFHPELTGRENIFLNGAILGMSQTTIGKHFVTIVEFSGIERFIDTPVKYYSSGMYLRLAFSISAHLDADILLLDEVLAVGDIDFYKKSQDKMYELARSGRTVLLVSHNLETVKTFCHRVMWVDKGKIRAIGDPATVIETYQVSAS